jgi:hypothetical protein
MENDNLIDPEDVNSTPASGSDAAPRDPNDEIPVPIAMSAAEIDERAQVVEALRGEPDPTDDDELLQP